MEARTHITCEEDVQSSASSYNATFDSDKSLDAGVELYSTPSVHLLTRNGSKRSTDNLPSQLCLSSCGDGPRSFLAIDWKNSLDPSRWVKVANSAVHYIRKLAQKLTFSRVIAAIRVEIKEALNHRRSNDLPKSICFVRDRTNLCTSWVNYNSNMLRDGESADSASFAASCIKIGGSVEFKAATSNGGIVYACVRSKCDAGDI